MEGVGFIGVGLLVVLMGLMGIGLTVWMIRRIWKRKPRASAATWVIALFVSVAATFAVFGTLVGLVMAFGAVGGESVDPSQKARILAEGISVAMNCTAFGVLLWIPSMIVALVLTRPEKRGSSDGADTS